MDLSNIALTLHLTALASAAIGIFYADSLAFKWTSGRNELLDLKHLHRAHTIVGASLLALVLTGGYMFWPARFYLIHDPLFLLKMTFVLLLILNSFVIDEFLHITTRQSFASLTKKQKAPLFISGIISTICWFGAGITALVLFYF